VHLKSLTLKGFKSFASSTTLRFEPGITCVVGPNGSGKSNVVDAISWVLGEQGAKALRGGKMEDVIFAGTSGRSALGRAEVTLTIDNADGVLPIAYAEVSITRRVFRSGAGEYEINGSACRLLDVQELLSDSGIGRELHVLVGQGQLDAILQSRPEERRAFIEEAAGVLKHRKRKEKALRKLEAMEANLARLADLTTELRRQLKPLGRQAEIARRAQTIQADLRDARLRLAADDLVTLRATIARDRADEDEARRRRAETERALAAESEAMAALEAALEQDAPAHDRAVAAHHRLSSLAERLRGTVALAAERHRHLVAPDEGPTGPDPDELERQAREAAATEAGLAEEVAVAREVLEDAAARREAAEDALTAAERRVAAARRAAADRREGLARLSGQVETQRGRVAGAVEELETLATSIAEATERAAVAREELAEAEQEAGAGTGDAPESSDAPERSATPNASDGGPGPAGAPGAGAAGAGEVGAGEVTAAVDADIDPEAALDAATERHEVVRAEVDRAGAAHRDAERDRAHWKARVEALELTLTRRDGAGELLAAGHDGARGSVAALLRVPAGEEAAITAALGPAAEAVVVTGPDAAADALAHLRASDAGRAGLVVTGTPATARTPLGEAPSGTRWAADLVSAPGPLAGAVADLLAGVVVVEDLAAARAVVAAHPQLSAATRAGDVLGGSWAVGGPSGRSILEMQSAADEAGDRLTEAERAVAGADAALEEARAAEAAARAEVGVARQVRDDHRRALTERRRAAEARRAQDDARRAEQARRLGRLAETVRGAEAEVARLTARRGAVETARDERRTELDDLVERLAMAAETAEADGDDAGEEDTAVRDAASAALTAARAAEVEGRLALRTAEERARAVTGRAEALRHRARGEREQRDRSARRRRERARAAALLDEVLEHGRAGTERIVVSVGRAARERDRLATARQARAGELEGVRERQRALAQTLEGLTDAVHRDEVLRAEQRTRLAQLEESIGERFGMGLEDLVREYGPDAGIPPSEGEVAEVTAARERGEQVSMPPPMVYDRAEQQRRAARAERELSTLGRVNPLALEEYAALEERYRFLSTQLEDVRASKRDLLSVVADVDRRILDVFAEAFADVAREFEAVFPVLFPGGDGRLVLTEPDDLLTTGVEVEARPPGKKVKRLSLLSGGEKSLTAVAMLVAIFRARPSPFYVLDEVEAALDDANLRRLIGLLDDLRRSSQLVIITHQKPTMEIADALYGVSMRGDGITAVVSQRLRGREAPGPLAGADPTPVP
jgi:chromosome segregation protein